MPRKYRPNSDDLIMFTWLGGVYGALKPIEEKLRAGGYKGPILADFDNSIYQYLKVVDEEATQKKQDAADKKKGGKAPKVSPVYKTSKLNWTTAEYEYADDADVRIESNITSYFCLSKKGGKDFREYCKKLEDYFELLIKNTPKEEYKEELESVEFYKSYLRIIRVFGSMAVVTDRMAFLINIRAYDADVTPISGVNGMLGVSRELWKNIEKNYPYSTVRNAYLSVINTACDYEEFNDKNNYMEQIKFRERYKQSVKDFYSALKMLENGPKEKERIAKVAIRADVVEELNKANKGAVIDYEALYNRVERQIKNGEPSSKEELDIYNQITKRVNDEYKDHEINYDKYNSKYHPEIETMGYNVNERNFTGNRGYYKSYDDIEVQLNALDMGWPLDEIPHVQRLFMITKPGMEPKDTYGDKEYAIINNARNFYNERIKDKPYPVKESERKEFYKEFYKISKEISGIVVVDTINKEGYGVKAKWDVFSQDIKKTMNKPLSFAERLVVKHVTEDPKVTFDKTKDLETVNEIKTSIDSTRRGHGNSKEYKALKKAYDEFYKIANTEEQLEAFKVSNSKIIDVNSLVILKDLRDSAKAYLNAKDKEKKYSTDRTTMGKNRYEGAMKAFGFADDLIRLNEAEIKRRADVKHEAERKKGRKETLEAFGNKDDAELIEFNTYRAGGKEQYDAFIAKEARKEADELKKEPVTDEEKYERFIDRCRTKKDDPVTLEDENLNKNLQDKRIDDYAKMLAAIELFDAGKSYDDDMIASRADELKTIYSLGALKNSTEKLNGPEKLKNALSYKFRATDTKIELEKALYEVDKVDCKNIYVSQNYYKEDVMDLLSRKSTGEIGIAANGITEALNEISKINVEDETLVGMNSFKIRKANVKLATAIKSYIDKCNVIDMSDADTKFAFDSLAVLDTYTGCKAVTNKLLQSASGKVMGILGSKNNYKFENFNTDFGVEHTKNMANKFKNPQIKAVEGNVIDKDAKVSVGKAVGKM